MGAYSGWKLLDRVGIVSRRYDWGYFVDPDNTDQIATAKRLAGIRRDGELTEENYYVTENKDFKLTIVDSAGGSSQGGKLSWWTVKITKNGKEWFTAINADQLCDLVKQSIFINGICRDTVSYATQNGSNSFLTETCENYKRALEDMKRKSEVKSQKKTSKHKIGKVYTTLTKSDAYIWDYYKCYEVVCDDRWSRNPKIRIKKIQPIKFKCMEHVNRGDVASTKFLTVRNFVWMGGEQKPPARFEDSEFDFTYDLTEEMLNQLEKSAKESILNLDDKSVYDFEALCRSFDPNYIFDEKTRKWLADNNVVLIE